MRKCERRRISELDGWPARDEWTKDDWADLWNAVMTAKRKITKRHREHEKASDKNSNENN